jgi:hypothetical protein
MEVFAQSCRRAVPGHCWRPVNEIFCGTTCLIAHPQAEADEAVQESQEETEDEEEEEEDATRHSSPDSR